MPDIDPNGSRDWVRLGRAWEHFCDFGDADSDRRAQLAEARRAAREAPVDKIADALRSLEFWERKIQHEFVWRIYDGDFDALGIDVSNGISNPETSIPQRLFDPTVESFSISWDENRLSVFEKTIVGIRVAPSIAERPIDHQQTGTASRAAEPTSTNRGGRPNKQEDAKALIARLLQTKKFRALPDREAQACEVRACIMGDDHRYSHGAKDYKTETIKRWIGEVERDLNAGRTG